MAGAADVKAALRLLETARTVFLTGHARPDGDSIGSELALGSWLMRRGKQVTIGNVDPVPQKYRFLPGADRIITTKRVEGRFDLAVTMECSSLERAGNIIDPATQAGALLNIDSHLHHGDYGTVNIIDSSASSTGEQVYDLMRAAGAAPTREEAIALYTSIVTDTGRFQYYNTSSRTHRLAAELLELGFTPPDVHRPVYDSRPPEAVRLLSRALNSLELLEGGRVAVMTVRPADFSDTGARPEDTEEFVDLARGIAGVRIAVFLREEGRSDDRAGQIKVSLRASGTTDVNAVARQFGGGGHLNASGCTLPGPLEPARPRLLSAVREAL